MTSLAAKKLAGLIALELDFVVSDETLKAFIQQNWERIAPLAHLIHEKPDQTKAAYLASAPVEPTPMQKVRNAVRRYGDEMAERVRQDYSNKYPSADPVKAEADLLKAIEDLVKA